MNNLKINFMKYIYCPLMGHRWIAETCRYMQTFGAMEAYYEGKCLNCGQKCEGLRHKFEHSGSLIFAENITENSN